MTEGSKIDLSAIKFPFDTDGAPQSEVTRGLVVPKTPSFVKASLPSDDFAKNQVRSTGLVLIFVMPTCFHQSEDLIAAGCSTALQVGYKSFDSHATRAQASSSLRQTSRGGGTAHGQDPW